MHSIVNTDKLFRVQLTMSKTSECDVMRMNMDLA